MQPAAPPFSERGVAPLRVRDRKIRRVFELSGVGQRIKQLLRNVVARLPFELLVNNFHKLVEVLQGLVVSLLQSRELLFLLEPRLLSRYLVP